MFCSCGPNFVILAWTRDKLSRGQASGYRTHRRTDRQTQPTTIPEGQNWPRVKITWYYTKQAFCITGPLCGECIGNWWLPLQRSVIWSFGIFIVLWLMKLLNNQSHCQWFPIPSRSCSIIVMVCLNVFWVKWHVTLDPNLQFPNAQMPPTMPKQDQGPGASRHA